MNTPTIAANTNARNEPLPAATSAVAARDQDAAHNLMDEHVKATARSVRALLKSLDARAAYAREHAR